MLHHPQFRLGHTASTTASAMFMYKTSCRGGDAAAGSPEWSAKSCTVLVNRKSEHKRKLQKDASHLNANKKLNKTIGFIIL